MKWLQDLNVKDLVIISFPNFQGLPSVGQVVAKSESVFEVMPEGGEYPIEFSAVNGWALLGGLYLCRASEESVRKARQRRQSQSVYAELASLTAQLAEALEVAE